MQQLPARIQVDRREPGRATRLARWTLGSSPLAGRPAAARIRWGVRVADGWRDHGTTTTALGTPVHSIEFESAQLNLTYPTTLPSPAGPFSRKENETYHAFFRYLLKQDMHRTATISFCRYSLISSDHCMLWSGRARCAPACVGFSAIWIYDMWQHC